MPPSFQSIFSVEKTYQDDFVLQSTIRYAHNKRYLESCALEYHFEVLRIDNITLRKQKNELIEGYLVLLRKIKSPQHLE